MSSQGPFVCSSGADGGGSHAWTNPNNVTSTTPAGYASCGLGVGGQTDNLNCAFNAAKFSVPGADSILGIEIDLKALGPTGSTLYARLSFGGSTYHAAPTGSFSTLTFGSGSDLWGNASITPTQVNGSWTVTLYGTTANIAGSFQVYDVTATVTYTTAGGAIVTEEHGLDHWRLVMPGPDGWW